MLQKANFYTIMDIQGCVRSLLVSFMFIILVLLKPEFPKLDIEKYNI